MSRIGRGKSDKARSRAIGIGIIIVLAVAVGFSAVMYSTYLPGGTIWQLDYQWTNLGFDGSVADLTFDESNAGVVGPGTWICDPDGEPTVSYGQQAGVYLTVGLAGRVVLDPVTGTFYTPPSNDYIDPFQESDRIEYTVDGVDMVKIVKRYYYAWEVKFESRQISYYQDFNWPCGILDRCESGEIEASATIGLIAEKQIFESNMTAYFADAHVDRVTYTPTYDEIQDDLDAGYIWHQEPQIRAIQSEGARIDIENQVLYQDMTLADMTIAAKLVPGVIANPAGGWCTTNYNWEPYPVAVELRIVVTVLQEQPFVLGHETDIDTDKPPTPPPPPGIWDLLGPWIIIIIAIAVIITMIVIAYVYTQYKTSRTAVGMAGAFGQGLAGG